MNEEIFDSIADQLSKSGVSVSKELDDSIIVTLPDSEEPLAKCIDNGDGTLSYTLYLGDGRDEDGCGTPEEFKQSVVGALDSWIEYVPYDSDRVEPGISREYRMAIGESREDAMRRSLFEMGLGDDQADAIMEAVNILFESAKNVEIIVGGKMLSGSSFGEIVKNNLPFIKKQWYLSKLKEKRDALKSQNAEMKPEYGDDESDKTKGNSQLLLELRAIEPGAKEPKSDELQDFARQYKKTERVDRIATDDDVLGSAWNNQFDKQETSPKGIGKAKLATAVMGNESPIESGEADDYDDEIVRQDEPPVEGENEDDNAAALHAQMVGDNDDEAEFTADASGAGDAAPVAANDAAAASSQPSGGNTLEDEIKAGLDKEDAEDPDNIRYNEHREKLAKILAEMGFKNPNINTFSGRQILTCIWALNELQKMMKFSPRKHLGKDATPLSLCMDLQYTPNEDDLNDVADALLGETGETDEKGETQTETMERLWGGDVSTLDVSDNYDIPETALAQMEEKATELRHSFDDILNDISSMVLERNSDKMAKFILTKIFGTKEDGLNGIARRIINGNEDTFRKIKNGIPLIDGSNFTPAHYKLACDVLNLDFVQKRIRRLQDGLGFYADYIEEMLPAAYDEACGMKPGDENSANGKLSKVEPEFVRMFRFLMFGKHLPFGSCPWDVVMKITENLSSAIKVSPPSGESRKPNVPSGMAKKIAAKV